MNRIALVILISAAAVGAQTVTGEISGTVLDESGASVPRAVVTLANENTGARRTASSTELGNFVIPALQPGAYSITVTSPGFRAFQRRGIQVTANERVTAGEIRLRVGETTETVTVRSEGELVQTESAQNTALLTPQQLDRMVIRGRDVMNLVRLLPGVSQGAIRDGGQAGETDTGLGNDLGGLYGTFTPNVSGTRAYWNTVTLDGQTGVDVHLASLFNQVTSVDAIAEVKVVQNNYNAEYGRNSGPQINLVSKGGSREYHGTLYWFKRHEQFNANNFFNNRDGLPKPLFRYTTLGGTLGGPVYIPGRFNTGKDKLFFFYSREDWRIREPLSVGRVTMPSALERRGDFSQTLDQNNRLVVIRDPASNAAFPGNIGPASRINRNGQALLNLFPLPNVLDRAITAGNYNYQFQEIRETPKFTNLLRLDLLPARNDTITVRVRNYNSDSRGYAGMAAVNSNWPQFRHHYLFTEDSAKVGWTRVVKTNIVNEFSTGFRDLGERGAGTLTSDGFRTLIRTEAGFNVGQFYPASNPHNFIPSLSFGGVPSAANVAFDRRIPINAGDQRYDLVDNLNWIHGSHSFKFGVYYERNWSSEGPRAPSFSGSFDFSRDPNNPGDSNWAYSNAILGNFRSYTEPTARFKGYGLNDAIEWFAQDTWKATRKLTLSYGLRFSSLSPWRLRQPDREGSLFLLSRYDRTKVPPLFEPALNAAGVRSARNPVTGELAPAVFIGAMVPRVGDPFTGMVLADDRSVPKGYIPRPGIQAAPRFGFAYDLFGNGKTAARGGFGITKQTQLSNNTYIYQMVETQPPRSFSPQIYYNSIDNFLQAQGVIFPGNVGAISSIVVPSVYNYSFSIQHALGLSTVVDVGYVGNVGRHLLQRRNLNLLPYGARFQASNADPTNRAVALPDVFLRPYRGYGDIPLIETSGTSNYNGLHVSANRRFSGGLQFGVAYTWSKAMGLTNSDDQLLPTYQSYRNWLYGKLGFDQTHKLVVNYLWSLPRASKLVNHAAVRALFDNWEWNGITTFSSGVPQGVGFSTTDNADLAGGGDGVRVNAIQRAVLSRGERTFARWFNTQAFARPARGDTGNAAKDQYRLPGINNWDVTFLKRIPIGGEKRYFQLRWELYNAFNHTQFLAVDSTARFDPAGAQVNARFGQAISARLPRVMQAALHFYF
jgi:hypothetical protein